MVNVPASSPSVRRREIAAADLDGVADALARGFPGRARPYWRAGLARMAARADVPPGCPRFGTLLEAEGRVVGVLLMLYRAEGGRVRCNLSSWTAEPAFRAHAPLLVAAALRRRDVTFTNVSAAPHTWATIESQGFRAYSTGRALALPALVLPALAARPGPARARAWRPGEGGGDCEGALLDRHAGYGCTALVVDTGDGPRGFVVLPSRIRAGRVPQPFAELVYCRDRASLALCAAPLGRYLARRGWLGLVVARELSGPDLPSVPFGRARRYARGPDPPDPGDLSDTERVIFGP